MTFPAPECPGPGCELLVQGPARLFLALRQGDGERRCSWKTVQAAGLLGATSWQPSRHVLRAAGVRLQVPRARATRGTRSQTLDELSLKRRGTRGVGLGAVWYMDAKGGGEVLVGVKVRETHAGGRGGSRQEGPRPHAEPGTCTELPPAWGCRGSRANQGPQAVIQQARCVPLLRQSGLRVM